MIRTFLLFQHLVTLLQPSDLLDFYHYETLKQEYPGKRSYVPALVLAEYAILVQCFSHFEKPDSKVMLNVSFFISGSDFSFSSRLSLLECLRAGKTYFLTIFFNVNFFK